MASLDNIQKLQKWGSNYDAWLISLTGVAMMNGQYDYMVGRVPHRAISGQHEIWLKEDQRAVGLLLLSLSIEAAKDIVSLGWVDGMTAAETLRLCKHADAWTVKALKPITMTSKEPSEAEISQVLDFASLDPQEDRSMSPFRQKSSTGTGLRRWQFRSKFSRLWNDNMFSADRDGSDNVTGSSFHIESMNQNDIILGVTPPADGCGVGAPSRPPSRSNDRSPLGGTNSHSREDEDMQRALRESAQEAGIALPQQESGILDASTSEPYFGPANRNDYEQANWAMVPTKESSKAAAASAPEQRKRAPGAPALLIRGPGSNGQHCLGGLLTILHEIPLARNIVLDNGRAADSYGFNSEWWKGQEILKPHILNQLQAGEVGWAERHGPSSNREEELHRLMAFLDSTDRSYGSVGVLLDLLQHNSISGLPPEKRLFEYLIQECSEPMLPLTQVADLVPVYGSSDHEEKVRFGILEMIHSRVEYDHIKTLYESLDHVFWDSLKAKELAQDSKMGLFQHMAEVLIISVGGEGPPESIEIPEELYPERYLASRKHEAQQIQRAWCETKQALRRVEEREEDMLEWKLDWNESLSKRDTLQKVMDRCATYRQYLESRGRFRAMEASGFDTDKYPDYRAAPNQMMEEERGRLEEVDAAFRLAEESLADLEGQLKAICVEKDRIKAKQRRIGKALTVPNKAGRPKPMTCKRYLLRGIATPNDVVYLRQPPEPDLIQLDDGEPPSPDQWWKLAYSPKNSSEDEVRAEKVTTEHVLADVWQETKTPLIIYATEEAIEKAKAPLPASLERFVRADNKAFQQELSRERSEDQQMEEKSPSKRKHRADSIDSNHASLGSVDMERSSETEMADLSDARIGGLGPEPRQQTGPEMQERHRSLTLPTTSPPKGQGTIDLELPDYHEYVVDKRSGAGMDAWM
ncbi:hypothetical protein L249_1991 [Ophiocordyceps polyrhachis-furcata BCC 54312]|uniref:Uncharacterized protein n=1 Tax=Ophiocordyceps polyrhachis-furcata BCC 54312 TaxID=1330021 RepID=A0A367LSE1_9HYPO|nr:hypothetical protein L249_1991 [Ophiocordyceps polyrhachis-furcata BCC 54312]